MENPLARDLDHVIAHTEGLWEELRGQRIFITGGTGFFGCWLLESFIWANDRLGLGASALVLTRDVQHFRAKAPHLASHPSIRFHSGDVRSFEFPDGHFSHIVHAATEVASDRSIGDALAMMDTIVQGTRHTLDFARKCGAGKFLLTSSGAVYGRQPPETPCISEDYLGAPNPTCTASAYGEGKRVAESLCALYAEIYGIETKIARGFAFVGPYQPLDAQFAIGDFIRDALKGGPIQVRGDGTPFRSYLYAADLAIWLWTILLRGGCCRPYNVGSDVEITIGELANTVAACFQPKPKVQIAGRSVSRCFDDRYVPSIDRAMSELGLRPRIPLQTSIEKTLEWIRDVTGIRQANPEVVA
ncbi:MAG: NAD-dependent epimerase/dehydratase family protein [Chloroflexi bacterium]|nr:NAD-dependent epimerase/dehydratase family protein [Chloroflexota bacterium]